MSEDKNKYKKESIVDKDRNISKWYNQLVLKAKLADYGPAKGTMVIRPYGYAIWENIQAEMDKMIKLSGAKNAYFPLFIPERMFEKEKKHVKGFSPELAVVTIAGGEKLKENLVVRPTSEMIMYDLYSKWISSWKDLPLVINQWNNVVRWEKRTYLFLRTSEFLWQEGHGAHATHSESWERVLWAMNMYSKINTGILGIPGIVGKKSESEKFAGGDATLTYEILIPSGKALQGCTSHDLGQNFSKAMGVTFQDKNGKLDNVWQNSWGYTTRVLGALVLVHGDNLGLVLPPKVAPIKAAIIPVLGKKDTDVLKYAEKVKEEVAGVKSEFPGGVEIWDDPDKSYGWKINEAELMGIPLKILVGTREMQERVVTVSKRTDLNSKKPVRVTDLGNETEKILADIQKEIFNKAKDFLSNNIHEAKDFTEFKDLMAGKKGFVKTFWCGSEVCEAKIKEETKATTRCLPLDSKSLKGECIYCGKNAGEEWYFAQSY